MPRSKDSGSQSQDDPWFRRLILGLDNANHAGAALVLDSGGERDAPILLGRWAVSKTQWKVRREIVRRFRDLCVEDDATPLVIAEKWQPGGKFGVNEAASCGASFGAWREALYYDFPEVVDPQIDRVLPTKWKSRVLASGVGWSPNARAYLSRLFMDATLADATITSDDELVAICVALYERRMRRVTLAERRAFLQRMEKA
jgi:hypothetical protein